MTRLRHRRRRSAATWEERRRKIICFLLFVGVVLGPPSSEWDGAPGPGEFRDLFHLLGYTAASFLRMLAAYLLSLFFAVACGTLAPTGPSRERIILPFLDIMQSVPVLGFFPAAVFFFVRLFQGSRLGVELAAIFLIFTCQAWNMAFGVYEGISTIPADAREVVTSFGCGKWKTFLRLLLPSAIPKLVYNSILSWANGWYFLIACEIIALGPARYRLPGLGSYLIRTTEEGTWRGPSWGWRSSPSWCWPWTCCCEAAFRLGGKIPLRVRDGDRAGGDPSAAGGTSAGRGGAGCGR
jgi:ABC-type nitrate/sulfonate/bicarbonate transport system permease component